MMIDVVRRAVEEAGLDGEFPVYQMGEVVAPDANASKIRIHLSVPYGYAPDREPVVLAPARLFLDDVGRIEAIVVYKDIYIVKASAASRIAELVSSVFDPGEPVDTKPLAAYLQRRLDTALRKLREYAIISSLGIIPQMPHIEVSALHAATRLLYQDLKVAPSMIPPLSQPVTTYHYRNTLGFRIHGAVVTYKTVNNINLNFIEGGHDLKWEMIQKTTAKEYAAACRLAAMFRPVLSACYMYAWLGSFHTPGYEVALLRTPKFHDEPQLNTTLFPFATYDLPYYKGMLQVDVGDHTCIALFKDRQVAMYSPSYDRKLVQTSFEYVSRILNADDWQRELDAVRAETARNSLMSSLRGYVGDLAESLSISDVMTNMNRTLSANANHVSLIQSTETIEDKSILASICDAFFHNRQFGVVTKPILFPLPAGGNIKVGPLVITIDIADLWPDITILPVQGALQHPHVYNSGNVCWGEFSEVIGKSHRIWDILRNALTFVCLCNPNSMVYDITRAQATTEKVGDWISGAFV